MEGILHQLVWYISRFCTDGFYTSQLVIPGIGSINSMGFPHKSPELFNTLWVAGKLRSSPVASWRKAAGFGCVFFGGSEFLQLMPFSHQSLPSSGDPIGIQSHQPNTNNESISWFLRVSPFPKGPKGPLFLFPMRFPLGNFSGLVSFTKMTTTPVGQVGFTCFGWNEIHLETTIRKKDSWEKQLELERLVKFSPICGKLLHVMFLTLKKGSSPFQNGEMANCNPLRDINTAQSLVVPHEIWQSISWLPPNTAPNLWINKLNCRSWRSWSLLLWVV